MYAGTSQDVPAYTMVSGQPGVPRGINSEGLKRRGFDADAIRRIKSAYKLVYRSGERLADALAVLESQLDEGLALRTSEGGSFDPASLHGAWTLVYLAGGACDQACVDRLTQLRQIRLGLGEGRKLVERLLLLGDPIAPVDEDLMARAFEGMGVARTDEAGLGSLLDALGSGPEGLGRVYILDPQGRLMMRYGADAPPDDVLNDLERLLKGSKNWIKGAQYGHK